ncbi:MAG: PIN domain-containing protein [Rhodanobacter sp.]
MYVLDTNVISALHKNYYRSRFVSLWKQFDALVADGLITSTREAYHELHDGVAGTDTDWAKANSKLFATPDAKEAGFVAAIYAVPHFQANIEKQKLIKGGRNADAFIIARAFAVGGMVVTMERSKPNAVKIPNICDHFKIPVLDLESFMEREGWVF